MIYGEFLEIKTLRNYEKFVVYIKTVIKKKYLQSKIQIL